MVTQILKNTFAQALLSKDLSKLKSLISQSRDLTAININYNGLEKPVLHVLIHQNWPEGFRALSENALDIDVQDKDGNTALNVAIHRQNYAIAELLTNKYNASITEENKWGMKPLHAGCKKGDLQSVELLLNTAQNRANIDFERYLNSKTILGDSALHYATLGNHQKIIQLLLDHNAIVDTATIDRITPMHYSAKHCNQLNITKKIIEAGARVDSEIRVNTSTPLLLSTANNCTETTRFLLKKGAKVNHKGKDGKTALHIATNNNNTANIKLLLQYGANPNITDISGTYPIQTAAEQDNTKAVEYLLMHRSKFYIENTEKFQPPLLFAAIQNSLNTFDQLSKKNPGLEEVVNTEGANAAHAASAAGNINILEYIAKHSPQLLFGLDNNYANAMHYAAARNQVESMKFLKSAGLSIDLRDKSGFTAAHIAVLNKRLEALKFLMESGTDHSLVNFIGTNLYQLAEKVNSQEIKSYLSTKIGITSESITSPVYWLYSSTIHFLYGFACKPGNKENQLLNAVASEVFSDIVSEAFESSKAAIASSQKGYCDIYAVKSAQISQRWVMVQQKDDDKPCKDGQKHLHTIFNYYEEDFNICEQESSMEIPQALKDVAHVGWIFSIQKFYNTYSDYAFGTPARSKAFWEMIKYCAKISTPSFMLNMAEYFKYFYGNNYDNAAQSFTKQLSKLQYSNSHFYLTELPSTCKEEDSLSYNLSVSSRDFQVCESSSYNPFNSYNSGSYIYYTSDFLFHMIPTVFSLKLCYTAFSTGRAVGKSECMAGLTTTAFTMASRSLTAHFEDSDVSLSQYYANEYIRENLDADLYMTQKPGTCAETDQSVKINSILNHLWEDWQVCKKQTAQGDTNEHHDEL